MLKGYHDSSMADGKTVRVSTGLTLFESSGYWIVVALQADNKGLKKLSRSGFGISSPSLRGSSL